MEVKLRNKLLGHKGSIYTLANDINRHHLLSGGGDGWLVSWPAGEKDGKLIADVGDQIFSLLYVAEQDRLAIGSMTGDLYWVSENTAPSAQKKLFHARGIYDLLTYDEVLISAGGDGRLGFWNLYTRDIDESVALSHKSLRCLALSPSTSQMAVGSSDGNIYMLKCHDWSVSNIIENAHLPSVFTLNWLDEETLVSGGRDGHLKVWNSSNTSTPVTDLSAHWYTINHILCHPEKPIIATASRDKTIRIWHQDHFQLIKSLDATKSGGHINSVNRLAWSEDGAELYAASDDATISVWTLGPLPAF
jgi:WD40 repeat protein